MRKILLATAIAGVFGAMGSAHAAFTATTIGFDIDGSGAGAGTIQVDSFDWAPGNALAINTLGETGGAATNTSTQLVAQSSLSVFTKLGAPNTVTTALSGSEFTFQLSFYETGTALGVGTAAFAFDPTKVSSFTIYYDANANANDITGTGYGDGLAILSGTVSSATGNYTSTTDLETTLNLDLNGDGTIGGTPLLDSVGADDQNGVISDIGQGSAQIGINVTYIDTNFFKSDITQLVIDAMFNSFLNTPFTDANPSDAVLGFAPNYGPGQWNGKDDCGNATQDSCDFHFQTDATTSFQSTVPEPGTLALLGLGLGALGLKRRRHEQV